ncbi:MAG: hypothetical protein ACTHJ2_09485 [Candidatus Nitrosocosmicus sp.]
MSNKEERIKSLRKKILEIKNHMIKCNYEESPSLTFPLDLTYDDLLLLDEYFVQIIDDEEFLGISFSEGMEKLEEWQRDLNIRRLKEIK